MCKSSWFSKFLVLYYSRADLFVYHHQGKPLLLLLASFLLDTAAKMWLRMSDFSALIVGHVKLLFLLSILCSITISVKTQQPSRRHNDETDPENIATNISTTICSLHTRAIMWVCWALQGAFCNYDKKSNSRDGCCNNIAPASAILACHFSLIFNKLVEEQ